MLFESIADGLSSHLGSTIQFGKWSVQLPPTNVDPVDYPLWCIEKINGDDKEDCSLNAMQLHESAGVNFNIDRFVFDFIPFSLYRARILTTYIWHLLILFIYLFNLFI